MNQHCIYLQITLWSIGGASQVKWIVGDVITLNLAENESLADRHLVGGQGTSLIRADDRGATQGLNRGQTPYNSILLGHPASTYERGGRGGKSQFSSIFYRAYTNSFHGLLSEQNRKKTTWNKNYKHLSVLVYRHPADYKIYFKLDFFV